MSLEFQRLIQLINFLLSIFFLVAITSLHHDSKPLKSWYFVHSIVYLLPGGVSKDHGKQIPRELPSADIFSDDPEPQNQSTLTLPPADHKMFPHLCPFFARYTSALQMGGEANGERRTDYSSMGTTDGQRDLNPFTTGHVLEEYYN